MFSPSKSCTRIESQYTVMKQEYGMRNPMLLCGCKESLRLTDNGKPENTYFVCYDRYFLQINAGWELTPAQMEIIGEKIKSFVQ